MSNDMKTHTAKDVSEYILLKCNEEGIPVSNKKLQKLLFYCQAWHLVFKDDPLFKESIQAWVHGPTVPSVYRRFKDYGFKRITEEIDPSIKDKFPLSQRKIMDDVIKLYGKLDADYLEALSHSEDPWIDARGDLDALDSSNSVIRKDRIREYYKKRYDEVKQ